MVGWVFEWMAYEVTRWMDKKWVGEWMNGCMADWLFG